MSLLLEVTVQESWKTYSVMGSAITGHIVFGKFLVDLLNFALAAQECEICVRTVSNIFICLNINV
jgi:hypothetical protein